jgi:hypothetical protein
MCAFRRPKLYQLLHVGLYLLPRYAYQVDSINAFEALTSLTYTVDRLKAATCDAAIGPAAARQSIYVHRFEATKTLDVKLRTEQLDTNECLAILVQSHQNKQLSRQRRISCSCVLYIRVVGVNASESCEISAKIGSEKEMYP